MRVSLIFIFLAVCIRTPAYAAEKPLLFVSIPPMQYLMQRIAGEDYEVRSLVSNNDNMELYEPGPKQLRVLSSARMYFPLGLQYETKWMPVIRENNPAIKIPECCMDMMRSTSVEHEHHNSGRDPHIWTDPLLNIEIAFRMRDALTELFPEQEQVFFHNHLRLEDDLIRLDQNISDMMTGLNNKTFIISHPAWSYLAERYGLDQIPLEHEGKEIGIRATIDLLALTKDKNIKTLFVQRQIKSASAETLAKEIDASIVELDSLSADLINNLALSARLISDSLKSD